MLKKCIVTVLLSVGLIGFQDSHAGEFGTRESEDTYQVDAVLVKRFSEAFGHIIGKNLENPGFTFDLEYLIKGIQDGAAGKESPMSDEEYESTSIMIQENNFNAEAESNLERANIFLAENAFDSEVVEVEPGLLQYLVLRPGEGSSVEEHNIPLVHYTGQYLDGQVFDSSLKNGEPLPFPLDQVIPGFRMGLIGAKEGEKRRLFIHPELGYGKSGRLFPPNALLIFDLEVVKANTQEEERSDRSVDGVSGVHSLSAEGAEEPEEAAESLQ